MNGCTQALLGTITIAFALLTMWMMVPTEQTLTAQFPNVVILRGFGTEGIEPISFDNNTLPAVDATEAAQLNGLFQFNPLFYHKTMDRFIPWEERDKAMVWECTMFCNALNRTDNQARLALVHTSPDERKNLWYLLELHDEDANSPMIYARSKFRKEPTYRGPWMTVTPGGEIKPRDLKDVHLITAWDAFRFDTPLKWGVTVALVAGTALVWWARRDD